jgi:hypothetical protein
MPLHRVRAAQLRLALGRVTSQRHIEERGDRLPLRTQAAHVVRLLERAWPLSPRRAIGYHLTVGRECAAGSRITLRPTALPGATLFLFIVAHPAYAGRWLIDRSIPECRNALASSR